MAKDDLIFNDSPTVEFATNFFHKVPVILQYDDEPLIQVVKTQEAGFTSEFRIYHNDGTYLAKVVGSRLVDTPDGRKAGVKLKHPDRMTVCEIDGKPVFEITRKEAAALKTEAELHTPDGAFVKCRGNIEGYMNNKETPFRVGGFMMTNNTISGYSIGVHVRSDGSISIGSNRA